VFPETFLQLRATTGSNFNIYREVVLDAQIVAHELHILPTPKDTEEVKRIRKMIERARKR